MGRISKVASRALPVLAAALMCQACKPLPIPPSVQFHPGQVGLDVGADATVQYVIGMDRSGSLKSSPTKVPCDGIASFIVTRGPSDSFGNTSMGTITVHGIAPGTCQAGFSDSNDATASAALDVEVVSTDLGVGDLGAPAGADLAGLTPICSVPVGFLVTANGRNQYAAYTDVDSVPGQTCPIHTSTDFHGDLLFTFLSGSPGYTIDGRGNYQILTAAPATLHNIAATSSADAHEDEAVTITFRKRVFPDQDASILPPTWTMTFVMKSDPDPAKWQVVLYSFSSQ